MPKPKVMEYPSQIRLVCPKCETQFVVDWSGEQSDSECPNPECHTKFHSGLSQVRAKRSRKSGGQRSYHIRVYTSEGEQLVEFVDYGQPDTNFEVRSGDLMLLSYVKDKPALIQNLTVRTYMKIKSTQCVESRKVVPLAL